MSSPITAGRPNGPMPPSAGSRPCRSRSCSGASAGSIGPRSISSAGVGARRAGSAPRLPRAGRYLGRQRRGGLVPGRRGQRLRGDHPGAEEAYRSAHRHGWDPAARPCAAAPGAGAQRDRGGLHRGRTRGASDRPSGTRALLVAQVEICIAVGASEAARGAADELEAIAASYGSSGLVAAASQATGSVRLAEGDPSAALPVLREACAAGRP